MSSSRPVPAHSNTTYPNALQLLELNISDALAVASAVRDQLHAAHLAYLLKVLLDVALRRPTHQLAHEDGASIAGVRVEAGRLGARAAVSTRGLAAAARLATPIVPPVVVLVVATTGLAAVPVAYRRAAAPAVATAPVSVVTAAPVSAPAAVSLSAQQHT